MNPAERLLSLLKVSKTAHAELRDNYATPIPILQWLVVIVLSVHVVLTKQPEVGIVRMETFVAALLFGNLTLVYGLPLIMSWRATATTFVIIDTLLIPITLLETGLADTSFYVVYYGIIMIAGASSNFKQALSLSAVTCVAYGVLELGRLVLLYQEKTESLEIILLRVPFFLVMTIYYGALAEFAQKQRLEKERMAKQAQDIRTVFSRYVSPRVVDQIIRDPSKAKIGGQRKELTMLFSDVVGFTAFSEKHSAEDVVIQLNEYFGAMTDVIFRWNGTLDKFFGDEIVVFWGAPIDQPDHVELAIKCALHMRRRLAELQKQWKAEKKVVLDIGIGIHTGVAVVGNIGAEGKKMEYTMTGDAVNLASRIQGLTRHFACPIIITDDTAARLKGLLEGDEREDNKGRLGHVVLRKLRSVKVKGKDRAVVVYALESKKRGEASVVEESAPGGTLVLDEK